jgi:TonB family protein
MNALVIYFIKVNIAIALLYMFYRIFFDRDTLLNARRYYLLAGVFLSLFYSLIPLTEIMERSKPIMGLISEYVMLSEVVITPNKLVSFNPLSLIMAAYTSISALLFVRLFVRVYSIISIIRTGSSIKINGIRVISINKAMAPFSFFGYICMNPLQHNEKETKEILTHELTHVKQFHSFDVLTAELLTILCWINPFCWLWKKEIRQNLEFIADDKVISSGFDSRSYQYHLLQLSYSTPDLKITNQFNISPLKKRIAMMNKSKTPGLAMIKYLLILPLTTALVFTSNAESLFSKMQEEKQQQKAETASKKNELAELTVVGYGAVQNSNEKQDTEKKTTEKKTPAPASSPVPPPPPTPESANEDAVFMVVENMPAFPGGNDALFKFLAENIKYPVAAQSAGVQGRVICQFVVERDGTISEVEVVRPINEALDAEAVRIIKAMPVWTPGTQKGKAVRVKYTLPINFRLQ